MQTLLTEAASPETSPHRLWELAKQSRRRGELARTLAANPNVPTETLLWLAAEQWEAFLQNPVFPLLLLEDPGLALRLPENALRAILREQEPPPEFLRALLRHPDAEIRASARLHRAQPQAGQTPPAAAGEMPPVEEILGSSEAMREMLALGSAPEWLIAAGLEARGSSVRELAMAAARESGNAVLLKKVGLLQVVEISTRRGAKRSASIEVTTEQLAALARGGPYARQLAAKHPKTPPEMLARLVTRIGELPIVRSAALRNPSLPGEALMQVALAGDRAARRLAVASKQAPAALLAQMASDPDVDLRRAVARHRATPSSTLARLAMDADVRVREFTARNPQADEATLRTLAKDAQEGVRESVARNRACPVALLELLATDAEWMVRMYAVRHPRMPGDRRLNTERFLRRGDTSTPEAQARLRETPTAEEAARLERLAQISHDTPSEKLAEFAADPDPAVRRLVAQMASTPVEALRTLAHDAEASVRAAVALHKSTPADVLATLSTDAEESVRVSVLSHPAVPRAIVEALLPDCPPAAKARIVYNKAVPLEIKDQIARTDESKEVRDALRNPTVPLLDSTLEYLFEQDVIRKSGWSYDHRLPLYLVEKFAAGMQNYSRPQLLSSNEYHCRRSHWDGKCEPFPPEFLLKLLEMPDDNYFVAEDHMIAGIAAYFAVTPEVLETCARRVLARTQQYRRQGSRWATPLTTIARNPKCPPALLVELSAHPAPRVRLAAITNSSFPAKARASRRAAAVQEGSARGGLSVRACALSQPEAPKSRLRAAALNGRWIERFAVAGNPACPRDLLAFLCEDTNVAVSDLARKNMRERFPDAFLYGKPLDA